MLSLQTCAPMLTVQALMYLAAWMGSATQNLEPAAWALSLQTTLLVAQQMMKAWAHVGLVSVSLSVLLARVGLNACRVVEASTAMAGMQRTHDLTAVSALLEGLQS